MDSYTLNASGGDRRFIEHLHAELGKGGRSTGGPVTQKVLQILYRAGWRPGWTKEKLASLGDRMFQGSTNSKQIAAHIAVMWLAELEYRDDDTERSDSIFQNLTEMGMIPKAAGKLAWMMNPLRNTCYTHTQLLLMCVEHAIECRPRRCLSAAGDEDSDSD
jgi:hypothetical protein